jgi:hypothetical protein
MLRAIAKLTLLSILLIAGSTGLFFYYIHTAGQRQLEEVEHKNQELEQIRQRLEADRRVARILVTSQKMVGSQLKTTLLFQETTPDGRDLPARQFTITGTEAHFDAEVIKFKDQYVEKPQDDPLRGQAIMLFTRVYGADQSPNSGYPIDTPNSIPEFYRGQDPQISDEQKDLWNNFWQLYNDKDARESRGIRAMDGQGLYGQFLPGHVYTITLRPTGDGSIEEAPVDPLYQQALTR